MWENLFVFSNHKLCPILYLHLVSKEPETFKLEPGSGKKPGLLLLEKMSNIIMSTLPFLMVFFIMHLPLEFQDDFIESSTLR